MVQIIVEIDASPRRAIEVISWALHEHNKVLRNAVPDDSVSYDVLGVHRVRCTGTDRTNGPEPSVAEAWAQIDNGLLDEWGTDRTIGASEENADAE